MNEVIYEAGQVVAKGETIYNDSETLLMIDEQLYQGGEGFSALDVFIRDVLDNPANYHISGEIFKIEDWSGTLYVHYRFDNCECMSDDEGNEIKAKCDCEGSYQLFSTKSVDVITMVKKRWG
jgi:hypothetical protein